MKIHFLVNEIAGGWKPDDERLGGTEESVVEWTKQLRLRGHEVVIYDNDTRDSYNGGGDVCINIKSSEIAPKEPTLYLTNETNASDLDLSAYRGVIWPSQWAKDNILVNNKTFILPHGFDPEKIIPHNKLNKQCLYASSPDRGLNTLLEIWPKVHEAHPDAILIVTYGAVPQNIGGVIFMGDVDEEMMNDLYGTSDIWCHPCSGGELYGISGVKAQESECIPVIIPTMALSETVGRGFKTDKENYAQTLIEVLGITPEHKDKIRKDVKKHSPGVTWEQSTDKLMEIILKVVN